MSGYTVVNDITRKSTVKKDKSVKVFMFDEAEVTPLDADEMGYMNVLKVCKECMCCCVCKVVAEADLSLGDDFLGLNAGKMTMCVVAAASTASSAVAAALQAVRGSACRVGMVQSVEYADVVSANIVSCNGAERGDGPMQPFEDHMASEVNEKLGITEASAADILLKNESERSVGLQTQVVVSLANVSSNFNTNQATHYADAYADDNGDTQQLLSPGPSKFMGMTKCPVMPARMKSIGANGGPNPNRTTIDSDVMVLENSCEKAMSLINTSDVATGDLVVMIEVVSMVDVVMVEVVIEVVMEQEMYAWVVYLCGGLFPLAQRSTYVCGK